MPKGAHPYTGKSMRTSCMPKSQGKMSSSHGTNSGNPTKGMRGGDGRVGAGTRGFKSYPKLGKAGKK